MAEIIDGKKISEEIKSDISHEVEKLWEAYKKKPGLAVVLVGEDPASQVYVRMKGRDCEQVGIESIQYILPEETTQEKLLTLVKELNIREDVDGILVQLPLPSHINESIILNTIDPEKDVDGFHPVNVGKLVTGDEDTFYPCTPYGCQELISRYVSDLKGKHLVIVGRSNIVGKPMANLMVQKNERANCVVTICHTASRDISYFTSQADILVVAAGRPEVVTGDMVKEGVVVIDVGVNRIDDPVHEGKKKLIGDVRYDDVARKASAITPVPGGVGPMTRVMLLKNTLKAFKKHNNIT
jgi:methylenetetrahydrofolate dehydrogenase (NADP+) / methenyltetrahydrofolate cyclohydrolase